MAPGLPFAIAGQLAYPGRQSVAIVGDGGFAMLMAEMTTAVQHNLPIKIIVLKTTASPRSSLSRLSLAILRLVAISRRLTSSPLPASGADGYHCERPEEVRPAIQAALASPRPTLVEAIVDPDEKPANPNELRI